MSMNFSLHEYLSDCFVETGTFHGGGIRKAMASGFKRIISIEVFEPLLQENRFRFQSEIEDGRVDLHLGDSAEILGEIAAQIEGRATFWLDAHIQTMNGAGVGKEKCPVVSELKQLATTRRNKDDIILIDDMRLIESRTAGWAVNLGEMYRSLWDINPNFSIFRINGHIAHDVLACVPR